ncbi:MAG: hypothetical protein FWG97_03365 [Deltaproteobacteria bacterium]|nr:hypothetical protein [Deltaproteobacteria bacterium]
MKKLYLIFVLLGGMGIGAGLMAVLENPESIELMASQKGQIESQKEQMARLADRQNAALAENQDLSRRVEELETLLESQERELLRLIDRDNKYTAENYELERQVERLKALAAAPKSESPARIRELEEKVKSLELLVALQKENLLRQSK